MIEILDHIFQKFLLYSFLKALTSEIYIFCKKKIYVQTVFLLNELFFFCSVA